MLKAITILALSFFTLGLSGAPACHEQQNKKDKLVENQSNNSGELKVLAQGSHSAIDDPFVAVIRDDETYASLRQLEPSLPNLEPNFLRSNIIVAAFLGTRNTGGYGVEVSRDPNGQIRVVERAPDKGMMVPQVITSPFKLVSVAVEGSPPVALSAGETFAQRAQLYRVDSGTFAISGGIAGRRETFQLTGSLQVTRLGNLITIGFALVGSGTTRERTLRDAATGTVKDNSIVVARLSRGSLIDSPSGDLHVGGSFAEKNKLTLDLDTGPVTVPDGYSGRGSIAATMVAASAN